VTPPLFIEVPVPVQGSEQSCICVLGVSILLFIRIFYSISEVIWLCGMFCFLQFILVLPYYFTIVYPVEVLDCVIIYRTFVKFVGMRSNNKKNKKKQHWILEENLTMTKGGTLRERSYNELQTFAKNAVKLRGWGSHNELHMFCQKKHENKVFEFIKHSEATIPLFRWLTMSYSSRRNEK
jgi:hypothetical protein